MMIPPKGERRQGPWIYWDRVESIADRHRLVGNRCSTCAVDGMCDVLKMYWAARDIQEMGAHLYWDFERERAKNLLSTSAVSR